MIAQGVPKMPEDVVEQRITKLEGSFRVASAQFVLAVTMGAAFWGIISKVVYDKLESIDESIERVYQIDASINLMEYRQAQMETLTSRSLAGEEEYRKQIQAQFERMNARLDQLNRGN